MEKLSYEEFIDDICLYIAEEIYREREKEARENFRKMKEEK